MRIEHAVGTTPHHTGSTSSLASLGPVMHAVLRVGAGLLFMEHGAQKLFGWMGGADGNGATVPLVSLFGLAGVLELVGGALIVLGLLTRPTAFLLAGQMVVAYAMAHLPRGGLPVQNQGELALLYALVFGFLVGNGAGPISLDAVLRRGRTTTGPLARPGLEGEPMVERELPRRRDTAA
jgi:putative oxidoreductase